MHISFFTKIYVSPFNLIVTYNAYTVNSAKKHPPTAGEGASAFIAKWCLQLRSYIYIRCRSAN